MNTWIHVSLEGISFLITSSPCSFEGFIHFSLDRSFKSFVVYLDIYANTLCHITRWGGSKHWHVMKNIVFHLPWKKSTDTNWFIHDLKSEWEIVNCHAVTAANVNVHHDWCQHVLSEPVLLLRKPGWKLLLEHELVCYSVSVSNVKSVQWLNKNI